MSGNTFGQRFKITTFGESHGPAMGCVVDGCPAGLPISCEQIQTFVNTRRTGQSRYTSQRKEADQVEILSGIFEGRTTGAPIALLIHNQDAKSKDYNNIQDQFRPGHGDYTYFHKYGFRDWRGGGRQSARETVARVAGGAIALQFLQYHGIQVLGYINQIGDCAIDYDQFDEAAIKDNPFFSPDKSAVPKFEKILQNILKAGDSVGASVQVIARGVPVGLGEPVFNRLDAEIAKAMMSINAAKAVEIGDGKAVVAQTGSQHRDEMNQNGFLSNHAGGILAGISSGQDIIVTTAFKPTSSIRIPGQSLNEKGESVEVVTKGRHDPSVGIRAVPICEAMLALVIADYWLAFYGTQPLTTVHKE